MPLRTIGWWLVKIKELSRALTDIKEDFKHITWAAVGQVRNRLGRTS